MFKIKKAAAFLKAAAILSIAALTGCQATIENLLTAPKLTQEQSEIYQALINSSGSSIKLKYPRGGEYRSAFVLRISTPTARRRRSCSTSHSRCSPARALCA